jgi:PleD family two-component response regulator
MTMREIVKVNATLARFGGEEFAVILPGRRSRARMRSPRTFARP